MSPFHKYVYIMERILKRVLDTGTIFFNINDTFVVNGTYFESLSLFL